MSSMKLRRGFTLIELLVTLAVMGVLIALAVPSFRSTLQSNATSTAVNNFIADTNFARSEAMKRSARVVLCMSNNPEAAEVPSTSSARCGANVDVGWAAGWIVFVDEDKDGNRDAAEPVLRRQAPLSSMGYAYTMVGGDRRISFLPAGRTTSNPFGILFVPFGDPVDDRQKRVLCINFVGRIRIAGDGSVTSCVE